MPKKKRKILALTISILLLRFNISLQACQRQLCQTRDSVSDSREHNPSSDTLDQSSAPSALMVASDLTLLD